jgi:hypothetical protein
MVGPNQVMAHSCGWEPPQNHREDSPKEGAVALHRQNKENPLLYVNTGGQVWPGLDAPFPRSCLSSEPSGLGIFPTPKLTTLQFSWNCLF